MKNLYIVFLVILVIIFLSYSFIKINKLDEYSDIINPSHYMICSDEKIKNKYEKSKEMLNNLGLKNNHIEKLKTIREKIKKPFVYGIKKKDDTYRLELYLYGKLITEKDGLSINKKLFKENVKTIVTDLGISKLEKIDSLFDNLDITLVSFDIDIEKGSYNDKLHLYTNHKYDESIATPLPDNSYNNTNELGELLANIDIKKTKFYTLEYDFIINSIAHESVYRPVYNYEGLFDALKNLCLSMNNKDPTNIINELKEFAPNPKSIILHYKYYNESWGVYLIDNTIDDLEKFLIKFNYKKLYKNKNDYDKMSFDFGINYNNKFEIISTGFSDYI